MASRVERPETAFSLDMTRQKRPRIHNDKHLDFIRSLPCLVTGRTDGIEAAHVRYRDARYGKPNPGYAKKPDDRWTIPLHWEKHREQHGVNERVFWDTLGIDPLRVALSLWASSGDYEAAEIILEANRGQ